MRNSRIRGRPQKDGRRSLRQPGAPRVQGIRLGGSVLSRERKVARGEKRGKAPKPSLEARAGRHGFPRGHGPHQVGHSRRALGAKRPSPDLRSRERRAQRHSGELPGAQGGAHRRGLRVRLGHRHRGHRPPRSRLLEEGRDASRRGEKDVRKD